MDNLIILITVYAIPVLFAITLHEAAHGYVARRFGDDTAYVAGRITLNPLKHIDPIGTVLVPLTILLLSTLAKTQGFLFGWAKPVPVNFSRLRHPKRDMIWVAAAGPGANLLMAILWALFLTAQNAIGLDELFFRAMAEGGIQINLVLMALNLLPIPPLDGGRIMVGLLPNSLASPLARLEPYGFFIIIALLATGTLGFFLAPFMSVGNFIVGLFS
jgi:Zn-dependent protease